VLLAFIVKLPISLGMHGHTRPTRYLKVARIRQL